MKSLKKYTLFALAFVLVGCKSVLDAPTEVEKPTEQIAHTDPQWQAHLAKLQQINAYSAGGQFGYISPDERFSSHFNWHYNTPTDFGLVLSSNLSSKSLKLQRNKAGLTISDSEGNVRTESDVSALMEEIIGVSFPIDQFAYWLKGQPEQGSNYILNDQRLLAEFDYPIKGSTWKASFVEYDETRTPALPKLIVLVNNQQTLKIRIDNWAY